MAWLFSQRLTVGKVTPSLAANFSWVSPSSWRRVRIRLPISGWEVGVMGKDFNTDSRVRQDLGSDIGSGASFRNAGGPVELS